VFECLEHSQRAGYSKRGAWVLLRYCEPVVPLYIPCTTVVHPLYTHEDLGGFAVFPPSPDFTLTAQMWRLFKGNRIFLTLQFSTVILSRFLRLCSYALIAIGKALIHHRIN
jgi:hypothetical protein